MKHTLIFFIICLLLLSSIPLYKENVRASFSEPVLWWNENYIFCKNLNITNNDGVYPVVINYTVNFSLDTNALILEGKMLENGSDLRIVYFNGSSNIELDRINTTAFNTSNTKIWFKIPFSISADGYNTDCYMYYGNPSAHDPPQNKSKVYMFYDGAESYADGTSMTSIGYTSYGDGGTWEVDDDGLIYKGNNAFVNTGGGGGESRIYYSADGSTWSNYSLEWYTTRPTDSSSYYNAMTYYVDGASIQNFYMFGWGTTDVCNIYRHAVGYTKISADWSAIHNPNEWHKFNIRVWRNVHYAYYDDIYKGSVSDATYNSGHFGFRVDKPTAGSYYYDEIILRFYMVSEPSVTLSLEYNIGTPSILLIYPQNLSIEASTSPLLKFNITDDEGDLMNVTLYSFTDLKVINTWINQNNATLTFRYWTLKANTTYQLYVNVTDGMFYSNTSWSFTTRETYMNDSAILWESGKTYYVNYTTTDFNNINYFNITNENITLHGQNYTLNGNTKHYGIYSNMSNTTIKYITIKNFFTGIYFYNANYSSISYSYIGDCLNCGHQSTGISLLFSKNISIYECHINNLSYLDVGHISGIWMTHINNSIIQNNNISNIETDDTNYLLESYMCNNNSIYNNEFYNPDNTTYEIIVGVHFDYSTNNEFYNNYIIVSGYGIELWHENNYNLFYNNYIHTLKNNVVNTDSDHNNRWNVTEQLGSRIFSNGAYIGGNFYSLFNGSGYSQIGIDADNDGFVDIPYVIYTNNTDYLAYSLNYSFGYPVIVQLYPSNNTLNVCTCCVIIGVNIYHSNNSLMNITFLSNYTGNWEYLDYLNITNVHDGWYYKVVNSFDIFNYSYYWKVNITDGILFNESTVFKLTTTNNISCYSSIGLGQSDFELLAGLILFSPLISICFIFAFREKRKNIFLFKKSRKKEKGSDR